MYEALSLPRKELVSIANSVSAEKNIDPEMVFQALEAAVEKIAKNKYGYDYDIVVNIDRNDGRIRIYKRLTVVGDKILGEDGEEVEFDSNTMIRVNDAKKKDASLEIGAFIDEELMPVDFGRSSFQSVRQIVLQKIKAAEKDKEYSEFAGKENTIVSGVVKRSEYGAVYVDINGKAEGIIKRTECIPRENLHSGDRIRALVLSVVRDNNGPQIFLTRSHPQFLAKLFEAEIPEVYDGTIVVKSVSRDPGSRAKVAVLASDHAMDPVGACVGMKGSRIQNIVNELSGEKIDVIEWTENVANLAVEALAPAKIQKVIVDEEAKKIDAVVAEDQLSLAIGRHGQNVRLASQLLGWGIDVMSEDESSERRQKEMKKRTDLFISALDIDDVIAHLLVVEGFSTIEEIASVNIDELKSIEGFDADVATELQNRAKNFVATKEAEFDTKSQSLQLDDSLKNFAGLSKEMLLKVGEKGVKTLDDLADLSTDELLEMLGDGAMTKKDAEKVILDARAHWFDEENK